VSSSQPPPEAPPEALTDGSEDDPYINKMVADRYRIIAKIGEGGMGAVYLAEHVFIEKKMALKLLHGEYAHKADLVARFLHEAKAASKIDHPNVVQISDFGQTETGNVFFAMEYLKGEDLSSHIKNDGPWKWKRAKGVFIQICRALQAAHSKGIIHRDMKPENVLLIQKEEQADFVKVLDFGIAKMAGLESTGGQRLTRTGMIFGTPEYMSPEQARGDKPDHRVDIYALGCIMYEMLTGDVPFKADTFMGVLTKHMFDPVPPPRKTYPSADIPGAVEALIMKALEKNRDKRFSSMTEMAEALEVIQADQTGATKIKKRTPAGGVPTGGKKSPSQDDLGFPTDLPAEMDDSLGDEAGEGKKVSKGLVVGVGVAAAALLVLVGVVAMHKKDKGAPAQAQASAGPLVSPTPVPPPSPPVVTPPNPAGAAVPAASVPTDCTVTITSNVAGANVAENGTTLGPAPYTLHAPCGSPVHHLAVLAHGYADGSIDANPNVPAGQTLNVDLRVVAQAPPPPPRPTYNPPPAPKPVPKPTPVATQPPPKQTPTLAAPKDLHDPFADP
jgi:serine/threonine-protein kinase